MIYSGSDVSKLLDNSKLLIQAVKLGNEVLVRKLLNHGIPQYISDQIVLNIVNRITKRLFHQNLTDFFLMELILFRNHLKLKEQTLIYYMLGCNPLYYAARYNHIGILKILLNSGGVPNVSTKMKRTPLQIAAYHGHVEIVQILIQNNADVNSVDSLGMSALHWAAENNHIETVKILLRAGANRVLVNKFGKTARTLSFIKNHYEMYELLKNWSDSEYLNNENLLHENLVQGISKPFKAVLIPESGNDLPELSLITKQVTQDELQNQINADSFLRIHDKNNETIKLIEQHGIKLLPAEQSTIIANAIKEEQNNILTVGKLTSSKTNSNIVRNITRSSDDDLHISPSSFTNVLKIDENLNTNDGSEISFKRKIKCEENPGKTKIIKIDAKELVNLAANKKLIIRPVGVNSTMKTSKGLIENSITKTSVGLTENRNLNLGLIEDSTTLNSTVSNMVIELEKKALLIKNMKKQLEMSMQIAKHYKSKYEIKEREALLYKTHLLNLTKMLSKSGIKISKIKT